MRMEVDRLTNSFRQVNTKGRDKSVNFESNQQQIGVDSFDLPPQKDYKQIYKDTRRHYYQDLRKTSNHKSSMDRGTHNDQMSFMRSYENSNRNSSIKAKSPERVKSFAISNSTSFCKDGPKISNIASERSSVVSRESYGKKLNTFTH